MGATVETLVELFDGKEWDVVYDEIYPSSNVTESNNSSPFGDQHYALFAFIGNVRNFFMLNPIAQSRGLPDDHESIEQQAPLTFAYDEVESASRYPYQILEGHSQTWVSVRELLDFNYDQPIEDRRCYSVHTTNGSVPKGEGVTTTYRELLGEHYFKELNILSKISSPENARVVFSFNG